MSNDPGMMPSLPARPAPQPRRCEAAPRRWGIALCAVTIAICAVGEMRSASTALLPGAARGRWGDGGVGELRVAVSHRVDLNRAPAAELAALPGIGPALATRIVDDRERHGPFREIDALVRVHGIGPKTLERIRPHATVGR